MLNLYVVLLLKIYVYSHIDRKLEYILTGDYMFFVFSKEKIFTYLVSILTVTLLFVGVENVFADVPTESPSRRFCRNIGEYRKITTNI